jgi:hypothetical protein
MIRLGVETDFPAIDSLRKSEGDSLGFIPKDAYLSILGSRRVANRERWKYSDIFVYQDNGDLTGFVYATYHRQDAKIEQIVIRRDVRRWERATALESLIRVEARKHGKTGIRCRVAYDIEANYFWRALGYQPVRQVISTWLNQRESKSKRPLWEYLLDFGLPLFSEGDSNDKR